MLCRDLNEKEIQKGEDKRVGKADSLRSTGETITTL